MLELMQSGIVDHWDLWFRPMPLQCLSNFQSVYSKPISQKMKNKQPPALSLKNLTGAFIILVFGLSISLLTFLGEQIISMPRRHRQRRERARISSTKSNEVVKIETDVENQSTLPNDESKGNPVGDIITISK
jgi:ionotropic glutamate receptor